MKKYLKSSVSFVYKEDFFKKQKGDSTFLCSCHLNNLLSELFSSNHMIMAKNLQCHVFQTTP